MVPQGYASVSRRPPDIEDYIDMLRRYRSWIIGPTFAGLVIAVVVAFLWPDTYISSAVMRITPQQVPERLVPSNINVQMGDRLTAMQQEILSRSSLSELIQRPALDLYKRDRQRKPLEDIVEGMRKDIKIFIMDVPTQQQGGQRRVASAFQISFAYPDRYRAKAVVSELVTKFTEQNVTVQRNQAQLTTSFLGDELKGAKENMDRLDAEVTRFKTENSGRLPEQLQANVQSLNSAQMQLAQVNEALNRNAQEKMMLETQLQNLRGQLNFVGSQVEQTVSSPNQAVKNERLAQLNKAIQDADTRLAALREEVREDHPDVRSLKAGIDVLRRQRDALDKEEQAHQSKQPTSIRIVNPQAAKMLEDIKMQINNTQAQIQGKVLDMEERVKQHAELQKLILSYQARIESSPVNEQRYAALMRDFAIAKTRYDELVGKKAISETASNLEERKAGENLEVLDAASLPEQPAEPNRWVISGIGTAMGLIVGLCMAGVKEMKDTSLKNLKDVRAYTNLPVLSSIPLLENALLVRRKRRLFWLAWSSAIIVGTMAMTGSMYYYFFGKA